MQWTLRVSAKAKKPWRTGSETPPEKWVMKNFQCKNVMRKKKLHPIADQLSDDDMNQIKHFGQMLSSGVTPFDEAVEEALNKRQAAREANAKKMKAAQTSGGTGLGPSKFDTQAIKQREAISQQAGTEGRAETHSRASEGGRKDAGEEMLRQGMAWVYDRYIIEASAEIQDTYRKAQEEAKADRLGLWSDPNSIPSWIFRDLAKAHQAEKIASNWIEAHEKQIDPNTPIPQLASPSPSASPVNSDDVWVNTKSGKYCKPGSRYYGKTKQGEYQSEEDAVQKGYRPANGTGE
jgi:hypothetical protein